MLFCQKERRDKEFGQSGMGKPGWQVTKRSEKDIIVLSIEIWRGFG
jgi:hypothetical protein